MEDPGILALVPTLVVIVLAVWSRRSLEPLIAGVIVGYAMIATSDVMSKTLESAQSVLADGTMIWILLAVSLFGALTHLIVHSGGAQAFSGKLVKFVRSRKSALMTTWVLGLVIFIDDYLNALTVGSSMKGLTDKHKVSRQMLAYIVDTTAAPICVLIPLSTWAVYVSGLLEANGVAGDGEGFRTYIGAIPYMLYPIAAALLVPLVALGVVPAIGLMKKAEDKAARGESTITARGGALTIDHEFKGDPNIWNFVVPIASLLFFTWWFGIDILMGVSAALVITLVFYGIQRVLTFNQMFDYAMEGIKGMLPAIAIIVVSFMLKDVNDTLRLTDLVIESVRPFMSAALLPSICFGALALIAFATGSFWGMYAIALPIVLPLGAELGVDPALTIGAVVSAGAFGSHACFYGDSTVLSATATDVEPMDHALTQLPYILIAAAIALLGFALL
ncbi:Na+/H+ antiporter NhaC family protein [Sedimentitalea sp. XS_ASV28]|uniref:Na+/H+ antiporter NhaC family protein n=1 Tax=Sedimentitalea sp. XS_ASV28 TaxID=3241296 RepID=UPI00351610E5